ncbi:hypothetical protein ABIC84_000033 [Mucilaginibacter sp. 3215]
MYQLFKYFWQIDYACLRMFFIVLPLNLSTLTLFCTLPADGYYGVYN